MPWKRTKRVIKREKAEWGEEVKDNHMTGGVDWEGELRTEMWRTGEGGGGE